MTPQDRLSAAGRRADTDLEPAVATALWLWDSLSLEVGEIALVTDGHPFSRLVAIVATWYGASPVLFVSGHGTSPGPGVTTVPPASSGDPAKELAVRLQQRPGVAAIDLSGRAAAVDLLLEALPTWSRLLLAGPRVEPFTIDYYVNVHRKGLRLVSATLDLPGGDADRTARMDRAARLLARPERRQVCLDALRASA